jgi:hypothetical protein
MILKVNIVLILANTVLTVANAFAVRPTVPAKVQLP